MKSIPKYYTEDHLKLKFSKIGEITDVKLMRTMYYMFLSLNLKSLFQSSWTLIYNFNSSVLFTG